MRRRTAAILLSLVAFLATAPDRPPPPAHAVELNALAADPRGGIWCGTKRGLVRLDVDGPRGRIAVPFADPDGTWQVVRALAFDAAGRLWTATDAGIARLE